MINKQFQPLEFMNFVEEKIRDTYPIKKIEVVSFTTDCFKKYEGKYANLYFEKRFTLGGNCSGGSLFVQLDKLIGFPVKQVSSSDKLISLNPQTKLSCSLTYSILYDEHLFPEKQYKYYVAGISSEDFQKVTNSEGYKQRSLIWVCGEHQGIPIPVPKVGSDFESAINQFISNLGNLGSK